MRVVMIGSDSTIFDPASPARARMRAYAEAIGELHIISLAKRGALEEQDEKLFLHPVFSWKIFKIRTLAKRAHAVILEKDIEIVSAQDPFEHGLAAMRAIAGTKAKLHIQVHTDFLSPWFVKAGNWRVNLLNRYRCRLADQTLPRANGIRVVSERVKQSILADYGSTISAPSIIPVAIDATVPAPVALPEHTFKFTLIAVSRLEQEKRMGDILIAFKLISIKYKRIGLFIVGDGRERARLERMVRTLKLEKQVVFLGWRADGRALLSSANVFIQASAYEGYGCSLIEAALAQVPIITTDVGIVGEVFKASEDALVVPVADPLELSHAVAALIEESMVRQDLSIHAEVTVRTHLASMGNLPVHIANDFARMLK